jgi:hypothetical protein
MKKQLFLLIATALTLLAACHKEVADVRDFGKITIDSISPGTGPSGVYVIVYGNNFSYQPSEATVHINNTKAQVIQMSPRRMMLYIPEGAASGKLHFTFNRKNPTNDEHNYAAQMDTMADGPSYIINESIIPAPIIEQVAPGQGRAGDTITIKGYNFSAGNCKVLFGTDEGAITQSTPTQLKVKIPKTTPGTVSLIIQQGTHTITAGNFVVEETPAGVKDIYFNASDGIEGHIYKAVVDEFGNATIQELYGPADGVAYTIFGVKADVVNGFVYWVDNNTIYRGSTDGTAPVTLVYTDPTGNFIVDMDLDENGRLYFTGWSSTMSGHHSIKRIKGDGTGPVEELYQLPADPMVGGLKVNVTTGKLYWTEYMTASVFEGSMEGQLAQPAKLLFDGADGLASPANIALAPASGHIYVIDNGNGAIYQGALDGTGTLQKLPVPNTDIIGSGDIEIDPVNHFVYWITADFENSTIMRAKTDGTSIQKVVNNLKYASNLDIVL